MLRLSPHGLVVAVFQWYEQEMTEARMRDRPLYGEVKSLFDSLDEDGSVRRTIIAGIRAAFSDGFNDCIDGAHRAPWTRRR